MILLASDLQISSTEILGGLLAISGSFIIGSIIVAVVLIKIRNELSDWKDKQ